MHNSALTMTEQTAQVARVFQQLGAGHSSWAVTVGEFGGIECGPSGIRGSAAAIEEMDRWEDDGGAQTARQELCRLMR